MTDQKAPALETDVSTGPDPDSAPESERTFKADRPEKGEGRAAKRGPKTSEIKTTKELVDGAEAKGAPTAAEKKAWEGKGWTKRWKEESRKAAEYFATNPETQKYWKALEDELDPTYSYIGQRDQVLHQYRQRFDPINDMLARVEPQWQMQGMSVQQGLGQMFAFADALARDPDSALLQLAQMFKPRDAARFLQGLSQVTGADLNHVAQGAPYIDPQVQQMVVPLQQRLQQMEQAQWQQHQQAVQQQQSFVLNQVNAFEQALDESGNKKHPFFREVFADMVALAAAQRQMGMNPTVEGVYNQVIAYHPIAEEWRAKAGERAALANAARVNDASKQAQDASRNVAGGKANGRDRQPNTLHEAMRMADRQLGLTSG